MTYISRLTKPLIFGFALSWDIAPLVLSHIHIGSSHYVDTEAILLECV